MPPLHNLKPHKYADVFPMLSGSDLKDLADDIDRFGLREPIITYHGEILDGRNRYAACEMVQVKPDFVDFEGTDLEAMANVFSRNLIRRHLDESQRAWIAQKLVNAVHGGQRKNEDMNSCLQSGQPKKNYMNSCNTMPKVTQPQAAEMLNVGTHSVQLATKVAKKGVRELGEAVEKGHIPVSRAAKLADMPKDVQKTVATLPTPKKAKEQAVAKGRYVWASDGKRYNPKTAEQLEKERWRTVQIFGLIHGLQKLNTIDASPEEYWKLVSGSKSTRAAIEAEINQAFGWLTIFHKIWEARDAA